MGNWVATGLGQGLGLVYQAAERRDFAREQSDLDVQRAQRIEEMRRQSADKERTDRASAINKEYDGMVGEAQAAKANELYGDGSNLKAEDLADEEKANLKLSEKEQLSARIKAGEKLGYDMSKERSALVHMEDSDARTADRNAVLEMNRQSRADRTNAMIENNKRTNSVRESLAASRGGSGNGSRSGRGGSGEGVPKEEYDRIKGSFEYKDETGEKVHDSPGYELFSEISKVAPEAAASIAARIVEAREDAKGDKKAYRSALNKIRTDWIRERKGIPDGYDENGNYLGKTKSMSSSDPVGNQKQDPVDESDDQRVQRGASINTSDLTGRNESDYEAPITRFIRGEVQKFRDKTHGR